MNEVAAILNRLPPYQNKRPVRNIRQDVHDILFLIMKVHKDYGHEYDAIARRFWMGNAHNTGRELFNFCKRNIDYEAEPVQKQTVKHINAILTEGEGDCKHYASFICGVCCALERMGYPIFAKYRYATYDTNKKNQAHIFAVIMDRGKEIWCDPVVDHYDQRKPRYNYSQDQVPPMKYKQSIGALSEVSGIGAPRRASFAPRSQHGLGSTYVRPVVGDYMDPIFGPATIGAHGKGKAKLKKLVKKVTQAPGKIIKQAGKGIKASASELKKGIKITAKNVKKIQPGKLLKKVIGAGPRNAFLALVKLNFADKAVHMHQKIAKNPAARNTLMNFWRDKLGGEPNKLQTAITQGVGTHNKLHPKNKVTGLAACYDVPFVQHDFPGDRQAIGVVPAAAALLAAAAPVIAAMAGVLKQLGIGTSDMTAAAAGADAQAAADHNNATDVPGDGNKDVLPDGSVDHGNGVTTKVEDLPDGSQAITYKVADPTLPPVPTGGSGGGGGSTDVSADAGAGHDAADTGDGDSGAKDGGKGGDGDSGGGLMAYVDKAKDWIIDNKKPVAMGGGAIVGGIVAAALVKSSAKNKVKKPVIILASMGAGAFIGSQIAKHI